MNSINYQQYKEFRCDKCSYKYCARYGSYSDRTSCRFHYWEKDENGIIMCRDCKKMPSEIGSKNCYHISRENVCCFACTIL